MVDSQRSAVVKTAEVPVVLAKQVNTPEVPAVVPKEVKVSEVPTVLAKEVKTSEVPAVLAKEVTASELDVSMVDLSDTTDIKGEYEHNESESYSIETEDGRSIEIVSYVNSSGVRMVEISADVQIPLTRLEEYVTTIVDSSAHKDQLDAIKNEPDERQEEFETCMDVSIALLILFLIAFAATVYGMMNKRTPRLTY